ncbi:MAG: surface-adhesin E family protein [Betaproteobacteria bacterium]
MLLALFSAGAAADWTAVGSGDYIYMPFADKATIHRNGPLATMSGLYDFRKQDFTPEGKGLFSTVVLREYDCAARRVRLLSSIDFAGHMGAGIAVSTSAHAGRWEPIVEGGGDEAYWKVACAEK